VLQERLKSQQLARQKIANLSRGRDEQQYRIMELDQTQSPLDAGSAMGWEAEIEAAATAAATGADLPALPSVSLLMARIGAIRSRTDEMRRDESALKRRSRDMELKFRRLVALATKCGDTEVDGHLEGLMRAVESEKGELEIGRVRRFLGGVEGVVH